MKKIMICILIIVGSVIYAETTIDNSLTDRIDRIEKEFNQYRTVYNEQYFQSKIEVLEKIVDYQEKVISGTNTFITIISVLLAIVAIIVPILTYLFGIKPSQDKIKDINKSLQDVLKQTNEDNINASINNLNSIDFQIRQNAINYLSLNQYYTFSDYQLNRMIDVIKKPNTERNIITVIENILGQKWSEISEDYFKYKIDKLLIVNDIGPIARFYANKGINNYVEDVIKIMNKDTQKNFLIFFIISLNNYSVSEITNFINNQKIIDSIQNDYLLSMENILPQYFETPDKLNIYHNSYCAKHIIEIRESKKVKEESLVKDQNEVVKEKTDTEIIEQKGIVKKGNGYIDNNGKKYMPIKYVPTFFGFNQEILTGIRVDNRIIPISVIKQE